MKFRLLPFLILGLFILTGSALSQNRDYFQDRLLIKYSSDQKLREIRAKTSQDPREQVRKILSLYGIQSDTPLLKRNIRKKINRSLPSADDVLRIREVIFTRTINPVQLAAKISAMPGVEYAEPRYIRRLGYTPNDPEQGDWIEQHNFPEAWDISTGSSETLIAIVDAGVGYTHPELSGNLWVNQAEVPASIKPQVDQNGDGDITSPEVQQYLEDNEGDNNGDGSIDLQDALSDNSSFMDGTDADDNGYTDDLYGWDFWASGDVGQTTEDNNPFHDRSDHGTHVAGIAAANTDNGSGIASAAFTATYLPVKAGGASADPDAIGFGFNGILYAAQQNADIINCSWGGAGSSQAEQEVINLVTEMGSLVIASAGNESSDQIGFPAGYDKVLSVGAITNTGSATSYTNYGYHLDVLAMGNNILSTSYDSSLVRKSGTSMSTPIVSGLAALVKTVNPGWTAERIGKQIRASATYIDDQNAQNYQNKLGHGSINAVKALNTNQPGIKITSYSFSGNDGGKLIPGNAGTVDISYTNLGNDTGDLELNMSSLSGDGIQLNNTSRQQGSIANGDTVTISFDITLAEDFDLNQVPTLKLDFSNTNGYSDFGILQYQNLLFDELAVNNVRTSLASDGTIGFTDPFSQSGGVGFVPRQANQGGGYTEGDNILFEGGLMLEIAGELYDAVRADEGLSRDFNPENVFTVKPTQSGASGTGDFSLTGESSPDAQIHVEAFAFKKASLSNVVYVKYTIRNNSTSAPLEDVYFGLFNDWDIGKDAGNNNASYNETDDILYLSDAGGNSSPIVAVATVGPTSGLLAIDNTIEGRSDSLTFGLYDGFTDSEKMAALTSETIRTELSNTDVSAVTAVGPYTINPGAKVIAGFIYAFGNTYGELSNQIRAARTEQPFTATPAGISLSDEAPDQTRLLQNYPNPFQGKTTLRLELGENSSVRLSLFDSIGRKIRIITDSELQAATHFIPFNATGLGSGVYFLRLRTEHTTQTIPITILK